MTERSSSSVSRDPIALIGMSGRFPGAADTDALFALLERGDCTITPIAPDRWPMGGYLSADRAEPGRSVAGELGQIDGIRRFDHRFFGISAKDAARMDPQQRLLLEEVWHCLEDAGVPAATLAKARTGVFVGFMTTDFQQLLAGGNAPTGATDALGSYTALLANRISHALDLTGPSLSIDAACASSLVALDQARQALTGGACDYALVAGVNLTLSPWKMTSFSQAGMLSPRGRSRTFDAAADGYVPGDGVVSVLLRRNADAVRDADRVHALILGGASSHSGRTASITHPSAAAQQSLIEQALSDAGVDPLSIGYIETHGTGTSLGDPIEVTALRKAYRTKDRAKPLAIGALKSNIGHLEGAAGLAGVVKAALMLSRKRFLPGAGPETLNPLIGMEGGDVAPVTDATEWPSSEAHPRRAAVSAFGFGGANAHVILQEAPAASQRGQTAPTNAPIPILLSAASPEALREVAARLRAAGHPLDDLAGTLATARTPLAVRRAALIHDEAGLRAFLEADDTPSEAQSSGWTLGIGAPLSWIDTKPQAAGRFAHLLPEHRWLRRRPDAAEALMQALGVLNAAPSAVCCWGDGVDVGLALARAHDLPLIDPETGERFPLRKPDNPWLTTQAEALKKTADAGSAALDTVTDLLAHQPTVQRLAASWDAALQAHGPSAAALIGAPQDLPGYRALAALIAADVLRRVALKWDLPASPVEQSPELAALSALTASDALPFADAVALLLKGRADASRIIVPTETLAGADTWPETTIAQERIDAWRRIETPKADVVRMARIGPDQLAELAVDLWRRGVPVDWTQVYPKGSFNRLGLPAYPFQGREFAATYADFHPEPRAGAAARNTPESPRPSTHRSGASRTPAQTAPRPILWCKRVTQSYRIGSTQPTAR
ncbi:beta-ketoacyl synthase N-terminal-like domain-containing protein [Breoghania sp. L-A4]|uniref:beta-ketoacyl synthase N-terminal-like domain-containing protein n=1 Tax=Breoghania sp. L-A4 TaxID=2304600 RepID=UPI000E359F07|nr:beta-ketoacyl synthase N-terminal-like domain-containing protein [Breoghania sp. L-A4]AXS40796.1 polyketide synthase [Breoghania sp. L-A4]